MREYLDFEKPIAEIEEKIEKLTATGQERPGVPDDLRKLREKLYKLQAEIYTGLTPWQRTQVARHPQRPSTLDYIGRICDRFLELHGDRLYGDDHAIVAGLARLSGRSVVVIGPQKGKTLKERVLRNFGMPNPEGYRKALRLMRLAERFNKPVITFIDTPGAYPGLGAEERGQSEAIARNLMVMASLKVPIVSVVIGEGGSGGALAIGVADRLLMLQYAVYSVISPEGCAAILWNDPKKTPDAAEALKMTAEDLLRLGVIDEILPEPPGGAHRDPTAMCNAVKKAVEPHLSALLELPLDELLRRRHTKYRRMGVLGGE
ncbi:MAG: acetyl-CoA carboxylase carboxyltransferase subunit alpha [Nitrospirae bacterium]|nr:MAG: acetyl-CoA carboxylase carboxyltransferase subunit alpha [Nitrospirota bacterium]